MSHDTDKLIRQLSLVAFLMAERRPLTARDVKSNVEGYSEMSDEAFARRFYSDRAELVALGVPLHSQRDEFTGEELYTLQLRAVLPARAAAGGGRAGRAPDGALPARRRSSPTRSRCGSRSRTSRSAGRGSSTRRRPRAPCASSMRDPDYSVEMSGRLTKLENAISKQRTIKFRYWTISRDARGRAHGQPVRAPARARLVVPDRPRPGQARGAHVPRLADPRGHPLRDEAGARLPRAGGLRAHRLPRPRRLAVRRDQGRGRDRARPGHGLVGRADDRARRDRGRRLPHRVRRSRAARCVGAPPGRPRAASRAAGARRRGRSAASTPSRRRTRATHPDLPASRDAGPAASRPSAPSDPVAPERFAVLQALLAYLLARCGDEIERRHPAPRSSSERFSLTGEQLAEHLALLNLVNFGGGCYAVYASVSGNEVRVQKELFGDAFRRAPRLTPLEARAIRLALEFVGPMIAAAAHTPLDRVRRKLEETFGEFGDAGTSRRARGADARRRSTLHTLSQAIEGAAPRRDRVPGGRRGAEPRARSSRTRSSASCRGGTSTPGTAHATRSGASGSTGSAASSSSTSVRAAARPRPREAPRGPRRPACSSRSRRRSGGSSGARASCGRHRRSRRCATGARSGSSARSSRTAAGRSCSSRPRSAAPRSQPAPGRSARSSFRRRRSGTPA